MTIDYEINTFHCDISANFKLTFHYKSSKSELTPIINEYAEKPFSLPIKIDSVQHYYIKERNWSNLVQFLAWPRFKFPAINLKLQKVVQPCPIPSLAKVYSC